jgi:hypothetical protein
MELALPVLLLGSLYISNNKKKQQKQNIEAYNNMGKNKSLMPTTNEQLLNEDTQILNNETIMIRNVNNNNKLTGNEYSGELDNQHNFYKKNNLKNDENVYSLTGKVIKSGNFKHNNMTPYIGSKQTQSNDINNNESRLDYMVGAGFNEIEKRSVQPMFQPEDNMANTYGMQNHSDFYQDRTFVSNVQNNTLPFEPTQVGPGLNNGYTNNPTGGFNSGMEFREKWMPKSVDEMRVKTNPKHEYTLDGLQGPSTSTIKQMGNIGTIENNKPDTFYENTPNKWFTTTGVCQGQTAPTQYIEKSLIKPQQDLYDTTIANAQSDHKLGYVAGQYTEPSRNVLQSQSLLPPSSGGNGPLNMDNIQDSYNNNLNNRSIINREQNDVSTNNISRIVGAVFSPLMDVLKPTKRNEFIDQTEVMNVQRTEMSLYNHIQNKIPHTIKETNIYQPNLTINRQNGGMVNNYNQLNKTMKFNTNPEYTGIAAHNPNNTKMVDQTYGKNQINNDIKENSIYSHTNAGLSSTYNNNINLSVNRSDIHNTIDNRTAYPNSITQQTPSVEILGKTDTGTQNKNQDDRNTAEILTAYMNNPYTHNIMAA